MWGGDSSRREGFKERDIGNETEIDRKRARENKREKRKGSEGSPGYIGSWVCVFATCF